MRFRDEILADRPSLFWMLGEQVGTVARDWSGTGRPATYVNSPARGVTPPFPGLDRGTRFNNSSGHVERAFDAAFDIGTGDCHIEVWTYCTGKTGGAQHPLFVRDTAATGNGINCHLQEGAGNTWIFRCGGTMSATTPLTTDRPHMFSFQRASQSGRVYMDGSRLIGGPTALTSSVQTGGKIQVGRDDNGTIALGGIFAVAFWHTRALSPARIRAHWDAGRGLLAPQHLLIPAPAAASQILRPDGDVTVGSWQNEVGGTTNLWQSIDEASTDDADYVTRTL